MDALAKKITENLDRLTTETDGVCDLCGEPVVGHPCPEHRAAAIQAQLDTQVAEMAEAWGLPLHVKGRF